MSRSCGDGVHPDLGGDGAVDTIPARIRVVTAMSAQRLETLAGDLLEEGWQLVGPVQIACGSDVDGGWNTLYAATFSGPAVSRGSGSLPGRDILDQDPLLDDTVRESIWDRR